MNHKDVYESMGALAAALPARDREEFARLVRELSIGSQHRATVLRWLRISKHEKGTES
jgi:hypothetical protein